LDGVRIISISMPVCLSVHTYQKSQIQISPNFLYMIPVAVAQSSSDGSAICFILWVCGEHHFFI